MWRGGSRILMQSSRPDCGFGSRICREEWVTSSAVHRRSLAGVVRFWAGGSCGTLLNVRSFWLSRSCLMASSSSLLIRHRFPHLVLRRASISAFRLAVGLALDSDVSATVIGASGGGGGFLVARVAAALTPAARCFLFAAALIPAARCFFLAAALMPAVLRFLVWAAFLPRTSPSGSLLSPELLRWLGIRAEVRVGCKN